MFAQQADVVPVPEGVGGDGDEHARHDPDESQARLPQVEAVHVHEDEIERAEEQVQDPQQDGGEEAQARHHRFQRQQ